MTLTYTLVAIGSDVFNLAHSSVAQTSSSIRGRYSVPLETVQTYTQRHELSKLLEQKIKVGYKNTRVPHAVVIHGLGGAGKSQLALNYAEGHKNEYDPILWIDGANIEAVRSSFKRCAAELGIPVDSTETKVCSLNDSEAVQAVLRWLRDRKENDNDWLVIIDNADDVSWGLKDIIPKGKQGNIIITSRDNLSPMLLSGACERLVVDVMSVLEARALLLQCLRWDVGSAPERVQQSCDVVVGRLGRLALAVNLAGAYIGNEPDQESALIQYVIDYDKHQDELLKDDRFRGLLSTEKTVWTVWDTTLEKLEKDYEHLRPILLLAFLARFKGGIIQDEMFHLASLGIAALDCQLDEEEEGLSSDIRQFLRLSEMEWDSFLYRKSRDVLLRYSLVQRVGGKWPGVTMHSLVQWRAMQYNKDGRWEWWYLVFVLAACHYITQQHGPLRFRRDLLVHIPEMAEAPFAGIKVGEKAKLLIERTFSRAYYARHEELSLIHKTLAHANRRRIVVLYGMGGIGKTQLAATYAEYHKADYSDVFWLDAKHEDSVKQSYAKIAKQILREHPSAGQLNAMATDRKGDEIVMAVKSWLNQAQNRHWLIMCDNYDNPRFCRSSDPAAVEIGQFLPEADHGSIIIISRSRVDMGHCIHVGKLDTHDSLQILSDVSRREGVMDGENLHAY